MVIVGAKPVPYVAPKPASDEEDDDPWSGNGCLDSRWIKSSTTDHKQKFRDEDSIYHGGAFNFQQIKAATRNFHLDNKIGKGSFGPVYKGLLPKRKAIAVKQQGKREFLNELGIISALNHPNLVRLLGSCIENNQHFLVYEYMENNSLANALYGIGHLKLTLNWETRFEICLGIAKGLAFLHEGSELGIIHGDIAPTNILLDKHLNAKISNFGSAKFNEGEETHIITKVKRINCYVAPEYAMRGLLTYKADVYSFGVVMLEILSGKSSRDYRPNGETVFLLDQVYVLYHENNLLELMDPNLKMDYNVSQANRALNLAIECTKSAPALRPKMSEVVNILKGRTELMNVPTVIPYSDEGFRKASTFAELSLSTCSGSTSRDVTSNHEKELLAGDHADIKDYDFEDAAPAMLHDNLSLMDEEEEDNISGVDPNEFEAGSSIPNVNNDQSIGDQTTEEGWKDDVKLLTERNFPIMSGPSESSNARESWSNTTLFTDNVTKMNEEDKRNLDYVEPTFDEDGKLCIEYSEEEFEEGCNEWKDSLVGFFVGDDKPVIMNTIFNKENVWGLQGDVAVLSMEHDYFLMRFKYVEDKIKVLESGPWHIENRPLILQEWNWKLKFDKANEMKITLPIWVKIYNLPLFLWTSSYLSKVGSALGTPLCTDEKTKNKERLHFARLCIEVDAGKSLPNSLNISIKAVDYEIKFEYEWKPLQCAKTEDTKQN